jgi:hypothetical protein
MTDLVPSALQLTGSDWSDLAPLLHVTTHKTAHEGRPVPLTTYVDWEALDAEMGGWAGGRAGAAPGQSALYTI